MVMVDYSSRVVPEVKVNIDTPNYRGEVLALCVETKLGRSDYRQYTGCSGK